MLTAIIGIVQRNHCIPILNKVNRLWANVLYFLLSQQQCESAVAELSALSTYRSIRCKMSCEQHFLPGFLVSHSFPVQAFVKTLMAFRERQPDLIASIISPLLTPRQ
jgi:hypothetical protein